METVTIRGEGITLDLLLWRIHGVRGQDLVEAALELNPGVADAGPVLALGTVVRIPPLPAQTRPEQPLITLFG
ncbi:tail protein X [Hoeflea sp.]|uniref:tail protein X n=1 Tax=Hoeflea sp. TaxID=1940281 RepID=UPI0037495736